MKTLIEIANEKYYNSGNPILSDSEFDLLEDDGLEIANFRKKIKHYQPMGSLKKIKTEEDFFNWGQGEISVTPKLDGNSIELVYFNGDLVQAITRGNGLEGSNVTDKINYCNIFLPYDRKNEGYVSYKAEAIMKKSYQQEYNKNIRNVVSGLLNKKEIDVDGLKKIDVVVFDTLKEIEHTFNMNPTIYNTLSVIFNNYKNVYEYEIDGLVVELKNNIYEEKDELLPSNRIALKFNKNGLESIINNIVWNIGKYGKLAPVLILQTPVEIDGNMVSRVSASNYGIVKAAGLGIGAKVKVILSGDIIPFVSQVIEKSDNIPVPICSECGKDGVLNDNGVDMICVNPNCSSLVTTKLKHMFEIFDLEFISDSTIDLLYNNGYDTITKIFNVSVNELKTLEGFGEKKAANLYNKLQNIEITEAQALTCVMIKGISLKNSKKIINHFGSFDDFLLKANRQSLMGVEGIGDILANSIIDNMKIIIDTYDELSRFVKIKKIDKKGDKGYIVFTGSCSQYPRKELEKILSEMGYIVQSGISKTTNLLLTDGIISGTKVEKAKKLGVEIKNYDEFFQESI